MSANRRIFVCYFSLFVALCAHRAAAAPAAPIRCAVALVAALFESGANVARHQAFGFHGTSVEALVAAAREGKLPLGTGGSVRGERRYWYFYPNVKSPTWGQLVQDGKVKLVAGTLPGEDADPVLDAWNGAVSYAGTIAAQHRLLSELGLAIDDANVDLAAGLINLPSDRRVRQRLVERSGKTNAELDKALRAARKAQGVVLLVAPVAGERLPVSNARRDDDGVRFEAPGGVDLEAFLAVEPLGDEEFETLEKLRSGRP